MYPGAGDCILSPARFSHTEALFKRLLSPYCLGSREHVIQEQLFGDYHDNSGFLFVLSACGKTPSARREPVRSPVPFEQTAR